MKFSFAYVKKNPMMFGTIFVVFGLLVYLMLNKSAASSGTASSGVPSYISTGPTDAEIAGQVALGQASIAANASNTQAQMQLAAIQAQNQAQLAAITQQGQTDIALATLGAKVQLEGLAVDREISSKQIDAQTTAIMGQFATSLEMQRDQNATNLAFYKDANQTMIAQTQINANLQKDLSTITALQTMVQSARKKDRDNLIVSLALGTPSANGKITGPQIANPVLTVSPPVTAVM